MILKNIFYWEDSSGTQNQLIPSKHLVVFLLKHLVVFLLSEDIGKKLDLKLRHSSLEIAYKKHYI